MKHFIALVQSLSTFLAGQERPTSLSAADTSSAFMVLASIRMLGEATTTSAAAFIQDMWEIELSLQNVGNMLKRLEHWGLVKRSRGSGHRNNPASFVLTVEGETELINGIRAHAVLLKAGLDSIQRPARRAGDGRQHVAAGVGNVTWLGKGPVESAGGDRRRAGGRKK